VDVKRQVGTVDGHVILDQCSDQVAFFPNPWMLRVPEKAVVDNHQVGSHVGGFADGGEAGIHGGGDAVDFAVIFHL